MGTAISLKALDQFKPEIAQFINSEHATHIQFKKNDYWANIVFMGTWMFVSSINSKAREINTGDDIARWINEEY